MSSGGSRKTWVRRTASAPARSTRVSSSSKSGWSPRPTPLSRSAPRRAACPGGGGGAPFGGGPLRLHGPPPHRPRGRESSHHRPVYTLEQVADTEGERPQPDQA